MQPKDEALAALRTLVGYRRDLVGEQTRRVNRLRGLLSEVFPGLEAVLKLDREAHLLVLTRVATPAAARRLGEARLARWLKAKGARKAETVACAVVDAAKAQRHVLPATEAKVALICEIASEALRAKERIERLEGELEELVASDPRGEVVRSLPGMGAMLAAEFLAEAGDVSPYGSADRLAAAAGVLPALRSSGSVSYHRRARRGNRALKFVFFRSAFCALAHHPPSRAFYDRKRGEGKGHTQALMALARRRVNVLWAMLRDGRIYDDPPPKAA